DQANCGPDTSFRPGGEGPSRGRAAAAGGHGLSRPARPEAPQPSAPERNGGPNRTAPQQCASRPPGGEERLVAVPDPSRAVGRGKESSQLTTCPTACADGRSCDGRDV